MPENLLLANLNASERERLQPFMERVPLKFKQGLIESGSPIPAVWFPEDSVTSTLVEAEDGSSIEIGLMGIEGMVGLSLFLGEKISNTTVIVQVPGTGVRMRSEDFLKHVVEVGDSQLFRLLQKYTNAFMGMVAQSGACNSLHPLEERLCRWILMTHDRVNRPELPLTQEFLSMMLGVRRPTISMTANVLKRSGFINYTRGSVTVLDREGLLQGTCECYDIINRQMNRVFEGERRTFSRDS
jgi:CRP-like cAMP-binding protein